MNKWVLSSVAAAVMLATSVQAAEINSTAGAVAGVSGGILMPDNDRDLETGEFYDVHAGYRFGPEWEVVAGYLAGTFDNDGGIAPAEIDPGMFMDVRYHFSNKATQPYVALGLSDFNYDYDYGRPDAGGDTTVSGAVGVKRFLNPNVFLNGEIKQMFDSEEGDTLFKLGVGYLFGQTGGKPAAPAPKPAPAPAPAPVAVVDSDNDGVADNLDQCPNTPAGVSVDSNGCALDSDRDGVVDYKDECPDTAVGARVDAGGCEIKFVTEKDSLEIRVTFDTNSANLRPGSNTEIQRAADFMGSYQDAKLVIEGHTDNTGSAAYNRSLSQRRADAVRTVLINDFGVDPERVSAIGYGEDRPIADNNTSAGRQANRRVVGVVEGQKSVRVKR